MKYKIKVTPRKVFDFILIILVFALTGSSTAYLSGKLTTAIGIQPWTFGFFLGWLFFIFPLYQLLTLFYAFIFGKFNFFYSRQKKIFFKLTGLFKK